MGSKQYILTDEEISSIPQLYHYEDIEDPICHKRIIVIGSLWCWYIMEISKDDLDTCFGYVIGHENELGYFSLSELTKLRDKFAVISDSSFKPTPLSEVKRLVDDKRVVGEG